MYAIEPALPRCLPRAPLDCGAALVELPTLGLEPGLSKSSRWLMELWFQVRSLLFFCWPLLHQSNPPGLQTPYVQTDLLSWALPLIFPSFIHGTRHQTIAHLFFFFFIKLINLFIFGCVGSSFLCEGSL